MKRNVRAAALLLMALSFCGRQSAREPLPGLGAAASHRKPKGTRDTIGVYDPTTSTFLLRNSNTSGFAEITVTFGTAGDLPIVGDWNGDGVDTVAIFRPSTSTFYLRNRNDTGDADIVLTFGSAEDVPLAGDWDGDGKDSIGVYRASNSTFYLRNLLTSGGADRAIPYGRKGDLPMAGDWDGSGKDSIGFYRPADSTCHLRKSLDSSEEVSFKFEVDSTAGMIPIPGDWDGDGVDTVALWTGGSFLIRNENRAGPPEAIITYGVKAHKPLAGTWTRASP
jgi:hypothetical protein